MNSVNPKALLHSKWTKKHVENREKHFVITKVERDEDNRVVECLIQAVINLNEYSINWRDLKDVSLWRQGWQ
ncbi:TIGR02450 family Trp-rich protein [Shewanella woodyi]|uniref:TIGR02450 family Trp-rich protein n=1 Tax=Shewanella woodyi TaxID=60961 RepID=UPI00374909F1